MAFLIQSIAVCEYPFFIYFCDAKVSAYPLITYNVVTILSTKNFNSVSVIKMYSNNDRKFMSLRFYYKL